MTPCLILIHSSWRPGSAPVQCYFNYSMTHNYWFLHTTPFHQLHFCIDIFYHRHQVQEYIDHFHSQTHTLRIWFSLPLVHQYSVLLEASYRAFLNVLWQFHCNFLILLLKVMIIRSLKHLGASYRLTSQILIPNTSF